ncbi:Cytochrome b5 isoform B [Zostera marina]|uniref:Cytochrome b5 isoform B n=1 Tax=Zostera marina TaxID=29655 RepID=A0A0K9NP34_ZOSMR|nr:Cytochrome b5 isoform B [Zostera marina]
MVAGGKIFTFDEVSKHNQSNDCWIIMNGKVYDVSSFMDEHPGGDEALLAVTGTDATSDFDDIGHSESAIELAQKYVIGEIDASLIPKKVNYVPSQTTYNPDKTGNFIFKIIQFMLPIIILAIALGILKYRTSV